MPTVNIVIIVMALIAVVALIVWFFTTRKHPEHAAGHTDAATWTTSDDHDEQGDRPAGPGAEVMHPDLLGGDHRPPTSTTPEADAYGDSSSGFRPRND